MKISFLIPVKFGDPQRDRILKFNIQRLQKMHPTAEILLGQDSSEYFNRSKAINAAAKEAKNEVLAVVDGDTVFNPGTVTRGLSEIKRGANWVIPYNIYYRTNKRSGEAILRGRVDQIYDKHSLAYDLVLHHPPVHYESPVSGLFMIDRSAFYDVGGFNESFEGWGYEDRGWVSAADCILGGHSRTEGEVFHVWHPESHSTTWDNPKIEANRLLAERMSKITDPEEMRQVNGGLWVSL